MSRLGALASLVLVVAPLTVVAQFGGGEGNGGVPEGWPAWPVQVETNSDSRVTGTLRLQSLRVDCDLGILEIKADKIKVLHFGGGDEPITVGREGMKLRGDIVTASGSTIKGMLIVPQLKMETDLGTLTLVPRKLRSITFTAREQASPKDEKPDPGRIELKPDPKPETSKPAADEDRPTRPSPIPRYLTHPSASRVMRIGASARPEACCLAPINSPAQSPSMKRRVMEP